MHPLQNWIPYKLLTEQGELLCRWLHAGDKPFSEPFFDDTIHALKRSGGHRPHSVANLQLLPGWSAGMEAVEPTAFIFHVSRCGSTLITQLLDLDPKNIVLSEVPFFDEILRAPYKQQPSFSQDETLRAAIQFYGQKRSGQEERLFIKTDSWHLFFFKAIRKLYPRAAFILLYRNPQEVIHSHQKKRGMQAVPGVIEPAIFGFNNETFTDLDVYMAKVLERYLSVFLEITDTDNRSLLVNYNQGMLHIMQRIAAFTGVSLDAGQHQKMEERFRYHAKYPDQLFTEPRQVTAAPSYLQTCLDLYAKLEEKRMATAASFA